MVNIEVGGMMELELAKKICRIEQQKELANSVGMTEWAKYLDEDQFLLEKIEIFNLLNLNKHTNLRVLDIGAGLGHFGSLCQYHGHQYLGTSFGRTSNTLTPFHKDANLEISECGIFPNYEKKIPKGPWDCIVMIRTTFELNEEWSSDDWKELYHICMENLKSGGQLFIKSNLAVELKRKYGRLETQCWQRMIEAFPNKSPLPQWSWATWHWIKE